MASEPSSTVQIGPEAINAVLSRFVTTREGVAARFEAGRLQLTVQGLEMVVHQLTFDEQGLTVRLSLDSAAGT